MRRRRHPAAPDARAARRTRRRIGHRVVPRRIKRVGEIDTFAIAADLNHLRPAIERLLRPARMSRAAHDATQMDRARLFRVGRVRDVVLDELPRPPTRNIKEAVIKGEVDIRDQRWHGLEALQQRR
jgi:hypothetical protein